MYGISTESCADLRYFALICGDAAEVSQVITTTSQNIALIYEICSKLT